MSILIFILVFYVLLSISLMNLFKKAGKNPIDALIPGKNFYVWTQIIGQPKYWALWLLFPIVNIFIFVGMCVDMVRSFGKYDFWHSALSVIYAPLAFFKIGYGKENYVGPTVILEHEYKDKITEAITKKDDYNFKKLDQANPYKKGGLREWFESIFFAVFAAAFIRMFLIEAYVIPTSSMEGSLLVGDYLFVSKAHYGIRMPMTVLQLPLLHNRIPILDKESYLKSPSLPYFRLPKIQDVERFDPVVFNYPEGDSVFVTPQRNFTIHDIRRSPGLIMRIPPENQEMAVRPIDKKDHYIKRCIGLPGDNLKIVNRQVFINDKPIENPKNLQYTYKVVAPNGLNMSRLNEWGININDVNPAEGIFSLSDENVARVRSLSPDISVSIMSPDNPGRDYLFPHDDANFFGWTIDNYGPIHIPKKGETVDLNLKNIAMYQLAIRVYENNTLEIKDDKIFINGTNVTNYTFKQDYYWMMGDNRHNSEDSRIWGFVPEDHIVGKPLFIWYSTKNCNWREGIRWDRILSGATKM